MEKFCNTCQTTKSIDEFGLNKTKKCGRHSQCKVCRNAYGSVHYKNNKQYYLDKSKDNHVKIRAYVWNVKLNSCCKNCPENHPATLDFHHRNPDTKNFCIGDAARLGKGVDIVQSEIDKCDILCANCHRKLHFELDE